MPVCELMENCSFYWNYRKHPDSEERALISRYCFSGEFPESCRRIQYLKENNESPPPCITPEGDIIGCSAPDNIEIQTVNKTPVT